MSRKVMNELILLILGGLGIELGQGSVPSTKFVFFDYPDEPSDIDALGQLLQIDLLQNRYMVAKRSHLRSALSSGYNQAVRM